MKSPEIRLVLYVAQRKDLTHWGLLTPTVDRKASLSDGVGASTAESCGLGAFDQPLVVEGVGAGFNKPADTNYLKLRFPRIYKVYDDSTYRDYYYCTTYQAYGLSGILSSLRRKTFR